ncbi:MAG TPA: hypothetical protein VMH91_03025 [Candidatus Paceibacterota bacterium]|nr:hypothetical protein [Candidatus Paceibacterota bacterium]
MVVRRTLNKLRTRSREDRMAIAGWIAIVVVVVLFIGWVVYFFQSITQAPAPDFQSAVNSLNPNGLSQAYASSTQYLTSTQSQ